MRPLVQSRSVVYAEPLAPPPGHECQVLEIFSVISYLAREGYHRRCPAAPPTSTYSETPDTLYILFADYSDHVHLISGLE
jgi:hypothetical protein